MKFVLALFFLLPMLFWAQDTIIKPPMIEIQLKNTAEIVVCMCDIEAEFPGGVGQFHQYLQKHLNLSGIEGVNEHTAAIIYVDFVVDEYGEIRDVEVLNLDNERLTSEVQRVFYSMPVWTPNEYECKYVKSLLRIPIRVNWMDPIAEE